MKERVFTPWPFSTGNSTKITSKKGFNYFVRASMECPASVSAQAAHIALACKQARIRNPEDFGHMLLQDSEAISQIINIANRTHSVRGVRVSGETVEKYVCLMVEQDFSFAKQLMILSAEELKLICTTMYRGAKSQEVKNSIFDERNLSIQVREMIQGKGRLLGILNRRLFTDF